MHFFLSFLLLSKKINHTSIDCFNCRLEVCRVTIQFRQDSPQQEGLAVLSPQRTHVLIQKWWRQDLTGQT